MSASLPTPNSGMSHESNFQPVSRDEGHAGNGRKMGREAIGIPDPIASFRESASLQMAETKKHTLVGQTRGSASYKPYIQPDTNKMLFGRSVRARRHNLEMSQEELGRRSGLHRTYICDVERGARNVSLDSIVRIANALQVPPAALFGGFEDPSSKIPN
jgi:DNA-binding XRE family transcriptional regulator